MSDDGQGYPCGLNQGAIPPYARICRLVDSDRSLFEVFLGLFSR